MVADATLSLEAMRAWVSKERPRWLEDYFTFLKFSSVSSEFGSEVACCAEWLADYVKKLNFEVELWPSSGHPVLFASCRHAGPDQPTLLIYNHYDVQPADPLEAWHSPPFEPLLREGQVYARGAQDNKGQCFYVLQALKLWQECAGSLPINVKLCIEGEEEMGSPGLSGLLVEKKEELRADYLAIVDLGLRKASIPALTLGVRGIVTLDVEVSGSDGDLHSGSHGGIAANPIHVLAKLLSSLRDEQGRITVLGFYEEVAELSPEERQPLSFHFDDQQYRLETGGMPAGGERHYSPLERAWIRPTLEINGICGGYSGPGFKTVIPAKAWAKISCRLVPDQQPEKIAEGVARYLENHAPPGVEVAVRVHPGKGRAIRVSPNARVVKSFAQAFEEVFKESCEFILEGASIPIASELAEVVGGEVILLGLGLQSDQIHAPNEHFGIDRLEKGMLIMARSFELLKYTHSS